MPEIRALPDEETLVLPDRMGWRRQIVQMITAEKNRDARLGGHEALRNCVSRVLDALEREPARA
jgi:hypothetical protein